MAAKKTTQAKPSSKAKQSGKDKSKVSNDPLADLGLDEPTETKNDPVQEVLAQATVKPAAAAEPETQTEDTVTVEREEVEVGEIEFGFITDLPVAKRKTEGSKYKFDKLAAPGVFEDGPDKGKPKYATFSVKLEPGVDADKLRRSVQSATTQANKTNKDKYFVSRTVSKDGEFVGMMVIRTDDRPK